MKALPFEPTFVRLDERDIGISSGRSRLDLSSSETNPRGVDPYLTTDKDLSPPDSFARPRCPVAHSASCSRCERHEVAAP
jgi:hypothetical protein